MSRFKKKKERGPVTINTSSLPDIIFMLLFFFMVATVMREVTLIVKNNKPEATEIQKLEKKSAVSYIYVGSPSNKKLLRKLGPEPRIQLDDAFAEVSDIKEFVQRKRDDMSELDKPFHTMSLKVDKKVSMGIVTDIKQELREVGAFKINYSTKRKVVKQ